MSAMYLCSGNKRDAAMHGGEVDQWRRGNQPGRLLMRQLQQHNTMHCNQRLPTQGPPAAPPPSAAACSGAGIISHLTLLSSLPPLPPSLNTHRSSLSKSNGRPAAKGLLWSVNRNGIMCESSTRHKEQNLTSAWLCVNDIWRREQRQLMAKLHQTKRSV